MTTILIYINPIELRKVCFDFLRAKTHIFLDAKSYVDKMIFKSM